MVDAVEVSPVEVLKELGDFASSEIGRRRWAPVEPGVSVRVAAARLARGAKWAAEYYVVRGKETVDTMRAALRAREASRPATLCTIYVLSFFPPLNGQKFCLKVRPGDTVLSLKQKIRDSKNIPLERQRLIIRGKSLKDGKRLYESNVFDGATVHLVLLRA